MPAGAVVSAVSGLVVLGVVLTVVSSGRSWGEAVTMGTSGFSHVAVVAVLLRATVVAGRAARGLHPRR